MTFQAAGRAPGRLFRAPSEWLGRTGPCECGRTHCVPLREVVYQPGAVRELPDLLARQGLGPRLSLVADARTYPLLGQACEAGLHQAGWSVAAYVVPDTPAGRPACDDAAREALSARLAPCDGFLAVGSGVISDLVKWIAGRAGKPYVMVATAASMNGYASNTVAPAIRGVKRVIGAAAPRAIAAVPSVIQQAPFELTASGLGDVLAKPVSLADWKLNQVLFQDFFCPQCSGLIESLEPAYRDHPRALRARDPAAIEALFLALIYSGVAMTMAGTSSPASGGEHLISHVLDMTAALKNVPHDLHGRQVGVGAIFAGALYERVLALEAPRAAAREEPTDPAYWRTLADAVEEEHAAKRLKARQAVRRLGGDPALWSRLRAALLPLARPASAIKQCLRDAGAAHRLADIGCPRERFLDAVAHAHQIRARYTVLDLARAVGVLPGAAEEIVDAYLIR